MNRPDALSIAVALLCVAVAALDIEMLLLVLGWHA